jgi:hypothetical protein
MPDTFAHEPLARCPIDGVPLLLVTYGSALGGSGVVMLGCPLCNKALYYQETAPPSMRLESGTRLQRPRRPRTPRPKKGYSAHGLRFADVERAFAEAEELLGREWRLKGRGHCRRVSIDRRYSRHAARGAARSWAWVTPRGTSRARRLLPFAIVEQAAGILGVGAGLLISREFI